VSSFRGLPLRARSATAAPRAMPEAGRLGRRALPVLRASATISRSSRADCSAGSLLDLHVRSRSCRGATKGSQHVKRLGCDGKLGVLRNVLHAAGRRAAAGRQDSWSAQGSRPYTRSRCHILRTAAAVCLVHCWLDGLKIAREMLADTMYRRPAVLHLVNSIGDTCRTVFPR